MCVRDVCVLHETRWHLPLRRVAAGSEPPPQLCARRDRRMQHEGGHGGASMGAEHGPHTGCSGMPLRPSQRGLPYPAYTYTPQLHDPVMLANRPHVERGVTKIAICDLSEARWLRVSSADV